MVKLIALTSGRRMLVHDVAKLEVPAADLKMIREALCRAQVAMRLADADHRRPGSSDAETVEAYGRHLRRLRRLQQVIDAIDVHRPLGADGKHGDRHTPTCGCEDR